MGVKYRDGQNYPETYEDYVPPGAIARCMLEMMDYLYPVGCYFETTDTDFDPNQSFGGTWVDATENYIMECDSQTTGSHSWEWKKYADGTFDAFGKSTGTTSQYATQPSGIYWHTLSISFPSRLVPINNDYSVIYSTISSSSHSVSSTQLSKTTTGFNAYLMSVTSGSLANTYLFHVHGRWKSDNTIPRKKWHRTA